MSPFFLVVLVALGVTIWAQFRVKGTFKKWSHHYVSSGMTGAEVARHMLDQQGLHHILVELVPGSLTDHYDPIQKAVRLSEPVYHESSISAISVACHEVGHAIQDKVKYPMLVLRHRMFPVVNIASGIAPLLLLGGILFRYFELIGLGVIFFSVAVFFQLITLPVEFNASQRAKEIMVTNGYVATSELTGATKVLNAAAFTYVAAALYSIMELINFILMFLSSNNDD
jgi:Zn-dependent membrane protease YugP